MVMIAQMKDREKLKEHITQAVCHMYELVSVNPNYPFHFPVGEKALLKIGYPKDLIDELPKFATESFAGVGYHFQTDVVKKGMRVLDIGFGSGTDLLIASKLVGPKGQVVGVDITDAMIEKAKKAILTNGFVGNTFVLKAEAEDLPFEAETFDVVISNGVLNLVLNKKKAFSEIFRVLKNRGVLNFADIVLGKPISEQSRQNPNLWAECVVGASLENLYLRIVKDAGFKNVEVVQNLDYFALSSSESTRDVAKTYEAHSVIIKAEKP
jgi:arsenite methyltransferase